MRARLAGPVWLLLLSTGPALLALQDSPPQFRAGVDLIRVDESIRDRQTVRGLAATGLAAVAASAQQPSAMDKLVEAYAAGDHDILRRTIRTQRDYAALLPHFNVISSAWRTEWTPLRAAFTLEVAVAGLEGDWRGTNRLAAIRRAAQFVQSRPHRPGEDGAGDRFETLFHLALLAFVQKAVQPDAVDSYLQTIDWRVAPSARNGRMIEPRFLLIAAIAQEQRASPERLAEVRRSSESPLHIATERSTAAIVAEALRRLESAAAYEATRAEALVRRAFLLHPLGRHDEALASLDAAPATNDEVVRYCGHLFRGAFSKRSSSPMRP